MSVSLALTATYMRAIQWMGTIVRRQLSNFKLKCSTGRISAARTHCQCTEVLNTGAGCSTGLQLECEWALCRFIGGAMIVNEICTACPHVVFVLTRIYRVVGTYDSIKLIACIVGFYFCNWAHSEFHRYAEWMSQTSIFYSAKIEKKQKRNV